MRNGSSALPHSDISSRIDGVTWSVGLGHANLQNFIPVSSQYVGLASVH